MVVNTLRELTRIPGVSGFEDRIRRHIGSLVDGMGRIFTDNIGNLYLAVGDGGIRILLAAHMDEIGLVVTKIEENGVLRFTKIGGIDDRILPSMHVTVHGTKGDVPGVIGILPPHLRSEASQHVIPSNELFIDIGAESRDEALDMGVEVLSPVTLEKPWIMMRGREVVASRSIDDRAGCAILLHVASAVSRMRLKQLEVIFAWTVQEEVGLKGAKAAANFIKSKYAVAVDTFSCCSQLTGDVRPGRGPVLRVVDRGGVANLELVKIVKDVAERAGVPAQIGVTGGVTDAAAIQNANVATLPIGIACNYTHSTVEKVYVRDVEATVELLINVIEWLERKLVQ